MSTEINATQRQEQALQRAATQRQRHHQAAQPNDANNLFADLLAQADATNSSQTAPDLTGDLLGQVQDTDVLATADNTDLAQASWKTALLKQRPPAEPEDTTGQDAANLLPSESSLSTDQDDAAGELPDFSDAAQALALVPGLPAAAPLVAQLVHSALSQDSSPGTLNKDSLLATAGTNAAAGSEATSDADNSAVLGAPNAPQHTRGHGNGLMSTQELQQLRTHTAPGRQVSAIARSEERTEPPPQLLSQNANSSDTPLQSWHMLTAGQPGSALSSDRSSNIGTVTASLEPVLTMTSKATPTHSDSEAGSGQPGSELGTGATNGSSISESANSDASLPDSFAQSLDQAMDTLGAQVSYWTTNNIRRATVRLDVGLKDPLDVEVRLKDGVAQVDFRTDDAMVRDAIKAQAPAVLSELLARSGIGLEGLSVGSNGSGQSGSNSYQQASSNQWAPLGRGSSPTAEAPPTNRMSTPVRTTGQGALDVFA